MQIYNAVFTALYNVNRGKGKRAIDPLRRKKVQKADRALIVENMKTIKQVEQTEGKGWIEKIYKANGMKLPERGKRG